jgi:hypothetical protein
MLPFRKLHRLATKVLPLLLAKPSSRWTKQDLWDAIHLHFNRTRFGLIYWYVHPALDQLEAQLRAEPVAGRDATYLPKAPGRPRRYTVEQTRKHWEEVQALRKEIAQEVGLNVDKVQYLDVAECMARRSFAKRGIKPSLSEVRRLRDRFADYFKSLNRKAKLGKL